VDFGMSLLVNDLRHRDETRSTDCSRFCCCARLQRLAGFNIQELIQVILIFLWPTHRRLGDAARNPDILECVRWHFQTPNSNHPTLND